MEVKWIYHNGIRVLALVVNKDDPYAICENCGKKHYSHPRLAVKEDKDWCGDCNDEYFLIESNKFEYNLDFNDIDICRLSPDFEKLMKEEDYAK